MDIITAKQAASLLNVTRRRIFQFIDEGNLPATKFGDVWLIKRDDIDKVKRNRVGRPKKI